jgi:O-glycosyl hydrolase
VSISGANGQKYAVYRTSPEEQYATAGTITAPGGQMQVELPPLSATTFFGAD